MAKISTLPAMPSSIDGTELLPIVKNGQTLGVTTEDLILTPVRHLGHETDAKLAGKADGEPLEIRDPDMVDRLVLAGAGGAARVILPSGDIAARMIGMESDIAARPTSQLAEIRDPSLAGQSLFVGRDGKIRQTLPADISDRLGAAVTTTIFEVRDPELAGQIHFTGISGAIRSLPGRADLQPASLDILLPRKIHVLTGGTGNAAEQANLYYKNLIRGPMADKLVNCVSTFGRHYAEFWRLEPGNTGNGYAGSAAGAFDLGITVTDYQFQQVASATTSIVPVSKTVPANPVRLLAIGDSITRDGSYLLQLSSKLPAVTLQGIRHYATDDPALNREGRGGWTMETYFTRAGDATGRDSPFLFPVGVSGADYRGNVEGWKRIINLGAYPAQEYDLAGFQKIARGWADTGAYLYDGNGYPTDPVAGWVVHDPALAAGSRFRIWTGSAWVAMPVQPAGWEFSVSKYLARYAAAFAAGVPTHISILMGANDFQLLTSEGTQAALPAFKARIDQMIASARAAIPGVKVIINLPTQSAGQDAWAVQLASGQTAAQYDQNIQAAARYLLTAYDTPAVEATGIHVCAFGLTVDPVHGFKTVAERPNIYAADVSILRAIDWVHPGPVGHKQAGDALAAIIQSIR